MNNEMETMNNKQNNTTETMNNKLNNRLKQSTITNNVCNNMKHGKTIFNKQ